MKRIALNYLLCICSVLFSFAASASEEQVIASLGGLNSLNPITSASTLAVQDQWYTFMTVPANNWSTVFQVGNRNSQVILRFDESQARHYTQPWTVEVTYSITYNDIAGFTPSPSTLTGQVVEISYDPAEGTVYRDKQLIKYENSLDATITITGLKHNGNTVTSLPSTLSDVYLDILQTTNRYYVLNTATVPAVQHSTTNAQSMHELKLYWNYIQGAHSYDVEWLFIDHPDETNATPSVPFTAAAENYDFRNATRVNVTDFTYTISLAYPAGILLYRIRPVGAEAASPGIRVEGSWSTGTMGNVASVSPSTGDRYDWTGLERLKNWQYQVIYSEGGKRKEVASFFDGSLRNRQSVTILNSDKNAIIGETKYDYEGRGVVSVLPTPLQSLGIRYYNNFNPSYDRADFDEDGTIGTRVAMTTGDKTHEYYSTLNTGNFINNGYTPDAAGYPMAQLRVMNDGSGRIKSAGVMGYEHQLGGGHETKYYYGAPQEREVDRLFGNEAGPVSHYQKHLRVDPNGQTSVFYLDQEGRMIAKALSGPNTSTNLLPLDGTGNPTVSMQTNLLSGGQNNVDFQLGTAVSHKVILISSAGEQWNFEYDLQSEQFCDECPEPVVCQDCYYNVEIVIKDENYQPLHTESFTTAALQGNIAFQYTFAAVGSYHVYKTLTLDQATLDQYLLAYEDRLRTSFDLECLGIEPLHIAPCITDCETLCNEQFTYTDSNGNTHYTDNSGNELDIVNVPADLATWNGLIAACTTACGTELVQEPDLCALRLTLISHDMSPGGQYFDNTPLAYIPDSNGEPVPNPSYNANGWTVTNLFGDGSGEWTTMDLRDASNNLITTWNGLRANWTDAFLAQPFTSAVNGANSFIEFHPEYCLYKHSCGATLCTVEGTGITMSTSNDYDTQMQMTTNDVQANAAGYFNPLNMGGMLCTGNGYGSDNSTYLPTVTSSPACSTGVTTYTAGDDPYFRCPSVKTDCNDGTVELMQRFLQHYMTAANGTDHYSIWYVLDDPDNIHSQNPLSPPSGLNAEVINAFRLLHDPTTGMFPTGQMTKTQFFTSAYQFYKQMIIYKQKPSGCTHLADADFETHVDAANLYQVRIPANPIYDAINICGDPAGIYNDVVAGAEANAQTEPEEVAYDPKVCSCQELHEFAVGQGLNETNAGDHQGIANAMNLILYPVPSPLLTAADIATFAAACTTSTALPGNFPVQITCPESNLPVWDYQPGTCSCENLQAFIAAYDLPAVTTADHNVIANGLNVMLQLTGPGIVNGTQVAAWLTECSTTTPATATLNSNNFPAVFRCPEPTASTGLEIAQAAGNADCIREHVQNALAQSAEGFEQAISEKLEEYAQGYREKCLSNLTVREVFFADYNLQEFSYTLYYYDQAGTLVKTVPPDGVRVLSTPTEFAAVDAFRAGTSSTSMYPPHIMISRYHFNSFQQLIDNETPDGGLNTYFSDMNGRTVIVQNASQASLTPNPAYTYIYYDNLGRIEETGEVITASAPTDYTTATPSNLITWAIGGAQEEVKRSKYDIYLNGTVNALFGTAGQENLRNNLATISYDENGDGTYENAIHYSYDIHGNVKTTIQENNDPDLVNTSQNITQINYAYDIISGNINSLKQFGREYADQLTHRYFYDADNRLTEVETNRDGLTWETEAKYFYYPHGLQARTETGDKQVQGSDHAYTINGWMKGVNKGTMGYADAHFTRDIGTDAKQTATNLNKFTGADAFGYVLGYFSNDYSPVNGAQNNSDYFIPGETVGNNFSNAIYDLFNGNIRSMIVALNDISQAPVQVHGNVYRYDKLNRLKKAERFTQSNINTNNLWNVTSTHNNDYTEEFSYDGNGNILSLIRKGYTANPGGQAMDQFTYIYNDQSSSSGPKTNKLIGVNDAVNAGNYANDIDDQTWNGTITASNPATWNYTYDASGRLVSDYAEGIASIEWTSSGKVKKITRRAGYSKIINSTTVYPANIEFVYNALGHRIAKIIKPRDASGEQTQNMWITCYYNRDNSGNILSMYKQTYDADPFLSNTYHDKVVLAEQYIYGNDRIGVIAKNVPLPVCTLSAPGFNPDNSFDSPVYGTCATSPAPPGDVATFERRLGEKLYEMTNHLGNVMLTVSDRKLTTDQVINATGASGTDGLTDYYFADIMSYSDYYAFGSPMNNRGGSSSSTYRFGFNGQEKDDEITAWEGSMYSATFWEYDARLGRRWDTDPIVNASESPYAAFHNNPICFADPDGLNGLPKHLRQARDFAKQTGGRLDVWKNAEGDWVASVQYNDPYNPNAITCKMFREEAVWSRFVNWLRRVDNKLEWGDDNHTGRKPVATNHGGFEQQGPGGNKNNHMTGDPEFVDDNYTPGSILAGLDPHPVYNPKKDIDDFDDLFDEDGAEVFKQLSSTPENVNNLAEQIDKETSKPELKQPAPTTGQTGTPMANPNAGPDYVKDANGKIKYVRIGIITSTGVVVERDYDLTPKNIEASKKWMQSNRTVGVGTGSLDW